MAYGYSDYRKRRYNRHTYGNTYRNSSFKRPRMAYGQRGYFRRTGLYGRFNTGGSVIPQRFVKGADSPEKKYFDYSFSDNASNPYIDQQLSLIPQGVGPSQRVGYKVCWKSLLFRMTLVLVQREAQPISVAGISNTVRIILYMDKQTNGAPASVADVLESTTVRSPMRIENSHRFRVIKDWLIDINRTSLTQDATGTNFSTTQLRKSFKLYKKLNVPQQYDGSTGLIATVRDYSLGVIVIPSPGEQINFHWYSRLRYTDN